MGWRAASILININGSPRELMPGQKTHHPDLARDTFSKLRLGLYRKLGSTDFSVGIDPDATENSDALYFGAYDGTVIISENRLVDACFHGLEEPFVQRLLQLFPDAAILAFRLHDLIGTYGYSYYERGEWLRRHEGSRIDGVTSDFGSWLKEEKPFFVSSYFNKGEGRVPVKVEDEVLELSTDAIGEEIVFALSARFLGEPLGEARLSEWEMEHYLPYAGQGLTKKMQSAWGSELGSLLKEAGTKAGLSVVRRGRWLYNESIPKPVTIVKLTGFDHPAFEDEGELKEFLKLDGQPEAYQLFFGELEDNSFELASHGPFLTEEEAVGAAEEKSPSTIFWKPESTVALELE